MVTGYVTTRFHFTRDCKLARVPRFCAGAIVRYSPSMRAIATVQKRGARDDLLNFRSGLPSAMIIIGTIIPPHAFVKAKRLIIYFQKNIKKPRQEKEGRNLPGKRKKCYNKMPTQFSRLYSLAIRFRLSFAFLTANIMPHCTKKLSR